MRNILNIIMLPVYFVFGIVIGILALIRGKDENQDKGMMIPTTTEPYSLLLDQVEASFKRACLVSEQQVKQALK